MRQFLHPLVIAAGFAVRYLDNATSSLNTYGLIYTGLTGDAFFPSARRANALTMSLNSSVAKYKKRFKAERKFLSENIFCLYFKRCFVASLTILTYAPLTLTFPFALATYLFVAHTLNAPNQALSAAMLAGGVASLVGLFCVGLVKDTADTLFICYCIDQDAGKRRRNEVFNAVCSHYAYLIHSLTITISLYMNPEDLIKLHNSSKNNHRLAVNLSLKQDHHELTLLTFNA
jgi:Plasma-membrane choline transporter